LLKEKGKLPQYQRSGKGWPQYKIGHQIDYVHLQMAQSRTHTQMFSPNQVFEALDYMKLPGLHQKEED
jgi:hypothetical protein